MIDIVELIYRVPNFISEEKSKKWIDCFEENKSLADHESSLKSDNKVKVDNYLALHLLEHEKLKPVAVDIWNHIQELILQYEFYLKNKISSSITKRYMNATDHVRIMKYEVDQQIEDHTDIGFDKYRASCTFNLHSPYEGGEFCFFSGRHKINLGPGEGIIFPAEQVWVHGVRPITKGTRYSINAFLKPDES